MNKKTIITALLVLVAMAGQAKTYKTITPDCRRVRDDLRINGYDNFDEELQRLKEKLK
jgi:hypothetical protein